MMNKRELIVLCLLAAGGVMQAQQWPDTPVEARPGARWWWLGSAVDEKNLTYNLEEYARTGMGAMGCKAMTRMKFSSFLPAGWKCLSIHKRKENVRVLRLI